jgi:hypothetical protein
MISADPKPEKPRTMPATATTIAATASTIDRRVASAALR